MDVFYWLLQSLLHCTLKSGLPVYLHIRYLLTFLCKLFFTLNFSISKDIILE